MYVKRRLCNISSILLEMEIITTFVMTQGICFEFSHFSLLLPDPGFTGGRFWSRRQEKIVETEMANLSLNRAHSLPDVSKDVVTPND